MTLANVLHGLPASKSGRNLLDANVMPSPCNVLVTCVCVLLLSLNGCHVACLKGGKEVDNAVIRTVGGEKAADVWIPRFIFNHKTICAGVTLTAEADLTSATCLKDDEPLEAFAVVESHGQNEPPVQVAHIDRCVKFDKDDQHVHDLMVCFHHCQWNFSNDVFVPRINLDSDRVPSEFDKTCSVMGFGHLTPDGDKCNVLHTMGINVGSPQDCGWHDSTIQNYICGATTEQQESCAVNGGEPLLCQHNSKFVIHGICKQEDCSVPQKFSKFVLLSYYREWLETTVPGLAASYSPQEETSSHGGEGDPKADSSASVVAPEQNNEKTDHAGDEAEKCPFLPHPPPVHIHHHSLTKDDRLTHDSSDDTSSSSPIPNAPQSGATSDDRELAVQNSDGAARHATSSAKVPSANHDLSGAAHSDSVSGAAHDPGLIEASAGSDGSDSDAALSPVASLPADDTPQTALSESGNATLHNRSPADDDVPTNTTPTISSPGDPATVVLQNSADTVLNVTVLLASLGDSWYLSNATNSAPHLSDSNEKLDLDQLEKLISDNGALLNFSYVVASTNLSLPGYRKGSVDTAPKLLSPASNELAKSGADIPNSIASTQMKSTGLKSQNGTGKPSQIPVNSSKPLPLRVPPQPHTDSPLDKPSSTAMPPQNHTVEPPLPPEPESAKSLKITPSQMDWLKKNGMRLPKNPLKNPRILGKKILFKIPPHKYDRLSRSPFAEKPMVHSESSGFPSHYREKWSSHSMSLLDPSFYNIRNDMKSPQIHQSHNPGNGEPKDGLSSGTVHGEKFRPTTSSRFPNGLSGGQSRKSFPNKDPHSNFEIRNWRNASERAGLSRDTQHAHPTLSPPTPTAERTEERRPSSSSVDRRQPEGTFFGALSSSIKTRLKRSAKVDEPSEWKTLLADLASWPARAGLAPSKLTPRVSFITLTNATVPDKDKYLRRTYEYTFKILNIFLPGGLLGRRINMKQKNLIWGPPITYDGFPRLKPLNPEVEQRESEMEYRDMDVGERLGADVTEATDGETLENRQQGTDEPLTVSAGYANVRKKPREVKNDIPTPPDAGMLHRTDGDSISAELGVKNKNHTDEGHNSSYNGSLNGTNVSDQSDSAIGVRTNYGRKETTLPAADTGEETTLSAVYTQKETLLPTVNTRKETSIPKADTRKEDTVSPDKKENNTLRFTTDAQKETTISKVDGGRETTGVAGIVSTPRTADEGKLNMWPTVRRTIDIEEPDEERYSTAFTDDMEREALQGLEDQNQEQADFYEEMKRLGADDSRSTGRRVASIPGLLLTLLLTWILMPRI